MAYASERDARDYEDARGRLRAVPSSRDSYGDTGVPRERRHRDEFEPVWEDRPTSMIPSFRERSVQAAAIAAEAERRGLMYRLARERMNNRRGTDVGLLLVRLATLLLLMHGIPKMMGFAGFVDVLRPLPVVGQWATPVGYAVVAGELALPVLVFFGLATRVAGALLAVQMLLTYVIVHLGHGPLLAATGGLNHEAAVLYAVLALLLACSGAGRISLDRALSSEWRERKAEREADRMSEE